MTTNQFHPKNLMVILFIFSQFTAFSQGNNAPNTLSENEISEGWKLLFDGKSSDGWRGACTEKFPEQGWSTDNGTLTVLPEGHGGDIVTESMYSNFEFSFDFKAPVNSNSGVKYFVLEDTYEAGKALGLEFQTHDKGIRPLVDKDPHPNTIACLYDLLQATNRKLNAAGEWNNARIVARGVIVEHWLNGIIEELLPSWFDGTLSPEEKEKVEQWKEASEENRQILPVLLRAWEGMEQLQRMKHYDAEKALIR
jgi:hypothetical protein